MKNKIIRKYKQNKIQISLIFKNYLKEPTFYDIKLEISQKSRFLIKNYNTITFRIDKRFSKKNVKNLLENLLDTKIKINSLNTFDNKKVLVSFYNTTETEDILVSLGYNHL